ncbi:MAG: transposase [Candidatus Lariskella arthropodorum]
MLLIVIPRSGLQENAYWQYFCGYDYFKNDIIVSDSCIRRFRQDL